MEIVSENFKFDLKYIGSSEDGRTNRWKATCRNCSKIHEPRTTTLAWGHLECPKCDNKDTVNYNQRITHGQDYATRNDSNKRRK